MIISHKSIFSFILCLAGVSLSAQVTSYGNIYIGNQYEVAVKSSTLHFEKSQSGALSGILGSERRFTPGFISFVGATFPINLDDEKHVDGYIKSYMTEPTLFPVGDNGVYRPAAISNASVANPTSAAYFAVNPSLAITSSLRGGNEPILPNGIVYPTSVKDTTLTFIDTSGYWDINGTEATKISLSWTATTNLSKYISDIARVTMVGWSDSSNSWEEIPSSIDDVSMFGAASTLNSGSISSTNLVPNTYDVYTLGFKKEMLKSDDELPNYISPNGDGINDKWILPASFTRMYPNAKVIIYNRYGNIVWRSNGVYQNNWGGERLLDNEPLPDGVYYYLLELDPNFATTKTGFVQIMRQ